MRLADYLNTLPKPEQIAFARRCGTSIGYLRKALSIGQKLGDTLSLSIERESMGAVRLPDLRPDLADAIRSNGYVRDVA